MERDRNLPGAKKIIQFSGGKGSKKILIILWFPAQDYNVPAGRTKNCF
jgi:hypothetical protein